MSDSEAQPYRVEGTNQVVGQIPAWRRVDGTGQWTAQYLGEGGEAGELVGIALRGVGWQSGGIGSGTDTSVLLALVVGSIEDGPNATWDDLPAATADIVWSSSSAELTGWTEPNPTPAGGEPVNTMGGLDTLPADSVVTFSATGRDAAGTALWTETQTWTVKAWSMEEQ